MTGREWQPGDVAWLDLKAGPTLGMRTLDGGWMIRDRVSISGYTAPAVTTVYLPAESVRPAAVVDPDSDDVDRLAELVAEHGPFMGVFRRGALQAALREFASPTPPKCGAALIVKGEHFACDSNDGHPLPHGNREAEAIWGEPSC